MKERDPLTDQEGEVRELTVNDLKRFRPVEEILPPLFAAKLGAGKRGTLKAPTKDPHINSTIPGRGGEVSRHRRGLADSPRCCLARLA